MRERLSYALLTILKTGEDQMLNEGKMDDNYDAAHLLAESLLMAIASLIQRLHENRAQTPRVHRD